MSVGNDLVDLRDPETHPSALNPRWDDRVFTEAERERLDQAADPHSLRWHLWAAKESAFKAAKRLDERAWFQPRAFETFPSGTGMLKVRYRPLSSPSTTPEDDVFRVWLDVATDWVHAMATPWSNTVRPEGRVEPLGGSDRTSLTDKSNDPSAVVRAMAQAAIARFLVLSEPLVEIVTSSGLPEALFQGRRLPVTVSLSHHGRFIAYGFAKK